MIAQKIQDSWSKADMRPVRRYVSQGVYNRFRIQLEMMRTDEQVANVVTDFKVNELWLDSFEISGNYQTVHVHLFASCRDAEVNASLPYDQAVQVAARKKPETFEEIYSFVRKNSAVTQKNGQQQDCPKCGAPEPELAEINKCKNCGYLYGSGEYDWVLAEITQIEEWSHKAPVINMGNTYSGFSEQVVEDRTSYLFWKHLYCTTRQGKSLNRDATDKFLNELKAKKSQVYQPAVGGISLQKVIGPEQGKYEAMVKVDCSYAFAAGEEPRYQGKVFHLATYVAPTETSLADHSCMACGGPLPETDVTACAYCGSDLPGKSPDWLIDDIK